ncbi:MAG: AI-2E family transporter [Burkholderiaceae bacterium]|jgi:predicted PurR-regulated permease PerM|nr:AI-2E family transporter [Burkholderiaceae bacterium]MDP4800589.1 AI-2E family transporter [Burkholderiaceae bacterium]
MTDALAPFAAALLLAYLLEPIARRLTGLGLPRAFSSVVAILVGLVVVVSMVSIGVPVVSHEIGKLQARLPDLIATLYAQVYPWLAQTGLPIDDTEALRAKLIDWLGKNTEQVSNTFFSTLQTGLGALVTILGWFILVPVVLFFLLKDWAMIMGKTIWAVPQKHRAIVRSVGRDIHDTLQGYLQGQVRVMAAMALYYAVALLLAGFSGWLSIGLLSGLLVFIPYAGFAVSVLLALVSGLLELGWAHTLIAVAVVYGGGQFLESFVLTPKLVGDRIGLHPLGVILALVIFGSLFGFLGVLLALPLAAVLLAVFKQFKGRQHQT